MTARQRPSLASSRSSQAAAAASSVGLRTSRLPGATGARRAYRVTLQLSGSHVSMSCVSIEHAAGVHRLAAAD